MGKTMAELEDEGHPHEGGLFEGQRPPVAELAITVDEETTTEIPRQPAPRRPRGAGMWCLPNSYRHTSHRRRQPGRGGGVPEGRQSAPPRTRPLDRLRGHRTQLAINLAINFEPTQADPRHWERDARHKSPVQARCSRFQPQAPKPLKSLGSASSPWVQIPLPPRHHSLQTPLPPPTTPSALPPQVRGTFYGRSFDRRVSSYHSCSRAPAPRQVFPALSQG